LILKPAGGLAVCREHLSRLSSQRARQTRRTNSCRGARADTGGAQGSLMAWLAAQAPDVAMAAAMTATAALWWPDEALSNAAAFCRCACACAACQDVTGGAGKGLPPPCRPCAPRAA